MLLSYYLFKIVNKGVDSMPKKQIKVLFLLIVMMVLTGCNVEYNLNISDDKIIESTNFYVEDDDLVDSDGLFSSLDEMVDYYYLQDYYAFVDVGSFNAFYDKNKINNDKLGLNLTHTYSFENFDDSYLMNYKYSNKNYKAGKDNLTIDISDFSAFYEKDIGDELDVINFNDLTINIKTDLKVLDNNADSVNGNIYTWNVDKDNSSDKRVYIKLKKVDKKNNISISVLLIIGFVLVIVLIVFYTVRKNNDVNKI